MINWLKIISSCETARLRDCETVSRIRRLGKNVARSPKQIAGRPCLPVGLHTCTSGSARASFSARGQAVEHSAGVARRAAGGPQLEQDVARPPEAHERRRLAGKWAKVGETGPLGSAATPKGAAGAHATGPHGKRARTGGH